jgi:beta-glucosidase
VAAAGHGGVTVTVDVADTGGGAGDLIVPVYVSQPVSAVLVPAKRLVGFTRTHLSAGTSGQVRVTVPAGALAVLAGDVNGSGTPTVEHGRYVFSVGTAADPVTATAADSITL